MSPRMLDLDRAGLIALDGRALTAAVGEAEGRTVLAEVIPSRGPLVDGVDNLEVVAAMGADVLVLNFVDELLVDDGWQLPCLGRLADLSALAVTVGRPIGVNLEPGDVPPARQATPQSARRLVDSGAVMLVLTANPGAGTTLADLARVTETVRAAVGSGPSIWAGKMHQAGVTEPITPRGLVALIDAGADGALLPLPGTVPGVTRDAAAGICATVHEAGGLVMGTIGTSQEGAHPRTLAALALIGKEIGVDVHHLGDAGLAGATDPESVYAYSVAVRGRRHTWRRMALGNRH
ncbi:MAG: hypothetical protein WCB04_03415 [Mycobacteriales bacterium]